MKFECPVCHSTDTKIINSKKRSNGVIYKRLMCKECTTKFSTFVDEDDVATRPTASRGAKSAPKSAARKASVVEAERAKNAEAATTEQVMEALTSVNNKLNVLAKSFVQLTEMAEPEKAVKPAKPSKKSEKEEKKAYEENIGYGLVDLETLDPTDIHAWAVIIANTR